MKSTLFRLVVSIALGLGPLHAMYDGQEEYKATLPQVKALQQDSSQEKTSISTSFKEDTSFESLPDKLFRSVFSFLEIRDLGQVARVSTRWKRVTEDPILWRYMGSRYYGDYLSKENLKEGPKQKVISHYLSVIVNAKADLKELERLVTYYRLYLYVHPFKQHMDLSFLSDFIIDHYSTDEGLILAQGNKDAINKNIRKYRSHNAHTEYEKAAVRALNELLVTREDAEAIERKIEGLAGGKYGYKYDPLAAREFNELLVEKEDLKAITTKIHGLE